MAVIYNIYIYIYIYIYICIGNRMNASAVRDLWARVMF